MTVVAVTLALALTGWLSASSGEAPRRPAILRNVVGGLLAMGVTYLIGSLVGWASAERPRLDTRLRRGSHMVVAGPNVP